jgi:hypothetical protein
MRIFNLFTNPFQSLDQTSIDKNKKIERDLQREQQVFNKTIKEKYIYGL